LSVVQSAPSTDTPTETSASCAWTSAPPTDASAYYTAAHVALLDGSRRWTLEVLEWRSHTAVVTGTGSANSTSTRCQ